MQMVNAKGNHPRDIMVDIRLLPTFSQAMQMIESCGIEITQQKEFEITINTRAKQRGGICKIHSQKIFIEISEWIITKAKADALLNTMVHELLHAVEGCVGHGEKWKALAFRINHKYNMNIKRLMTAEDVGISLYDLWSDDKPPKYICRCEGCGYEIKKQRASKFTRFPYLYKHPRCGGTFALVS